jgi:hypothetical protein
MSNPMDSEDRWYDAARRADQEALLQLLPVGTARAGTIASTVTAVSLATVVGYWLVFLPASDGQVWSDGIDFATRAAAGLTRVGALVCLALWLMQLLIKRSRARPWSLISGALNREEKRDVRRQISGEDLLDQNRLHLIVMIAKQHHLAVGNAAILYLAMVFANVHWALITTVPAVTYLSAAVAVVLLAVGAWMLVAYRRTGAFIARHANVKYQPTRAHILELEKLYPDDDFDNEASDKPENRADERPNPAGAR